MNIMLANVYERMKEIGTRRALGARQKDILYQFLAESTVLSNVGGVLGIFLGLFTAKMITFYSDWPTVISLQSIVYSFGISTLVGILFGTYPACQAAKLDPIEALRSE
jgi:ABC-type antimicrobial peptide transport system permease subunit